MGKAVPAVQPSKHTTCGVKASPAPVCWLVSRDFWGAVRWLRVQPAVCSIRTVALTRMAVLRGVATSSGLLWTLGLRQQLAVVSSCFGGVPGWFWSAFFKPGRHGDDVWRHVSAVRRRWQWARGSCLRRPPPSTLFSESRPLHSPCRSGPSGTCLRQGGSSSLGVYAGPGGVRCCVSRGPHAPGARLGGGRYPGCPRCRRRAGGEGGGRVVTAREGEGPALPGGRSNARLSWEAAAQVNSFVKLLRKRNWGKKYNIW